MDQLLPIGVRVVPMVGQHYDKFTDPAKYKYDKMRGRVPKPDPDTQSQRNHEDKGYVLRKRSEVQSDEEIVEVVRHRGERLPRRPGLPRQVSSMDDMRGGQMVPYRGGRNDRSESNDPRDRQLARRSTTGDAIARRGGAAGGAAGEWSDSEGSVPPRSRQNGRSKSQSGKSKSGRRRNPSSSSSSSLCSSTEDEKHIKKARRKKWITAGLAGVATVHAASKVYSSIESHDKRILAVQAGTISPEEAHKKQRAARWQDGAAIAIAALGIKGALSEWNETVEEHHEHQKLMEEKEEHHKKRLERERRKAAKKDGYGGYYKGRDGNWYYAGDGKQGHSGGGGSSNGGGRGSQKQITDGRSSSQKQITDGRSRSVVSRNTRYADDEDDDIDAGGRSRSRRRRRDS